MLRLPENRRHLFQSPFGTLVAEVSSLSTELSCRHLYTVGDVITRNLLEMGLIPDVAVVDGHTMRAPCRGTPDVFPTVIHAVNPPGTITGMLVEALKQAVSSPPALVVVEGEEDLAVIPLVMEAPDGVWILYGQPGQGVVIREINDAARRKANKLLACFIEESDE